MNYRYSAESGVALILDRRRLRRSRTGWQWVRPIKDNGGDVDSWTSVIPQPVAGINRIVATGFLVSRKQVMTAGHCVKGGSCFTGSLKAEEMAFVFDLTESWFHSGRLPAISDSQVYFGSRLLAGQFNARFMDIPDWAVIELDRPAAQTRTRFIAARNPNREKEAHIVGHPDGCLQTSWSGRLISHVPMTHGPFCLLQAPALPGASGSPVLNRHGRLLGVLAGSASDAAIKTIGGRDVTTGTAPVSRMTPSSIFRDWLS